LLPTSRYYFLSIPLPTGNEESVEASTSKTMPPKARGLSGALRNKGLRLQASGSIRTNLIVDKVVLVASKDCRRRMFFRRLFSFLISSMSTYTHVSRIASRGPGPAVMQTNEAQRSFPMFGARD
jgi:hypothetical protein